MNFAKIFSLMLFSLGLLLFPRAGFAHCDTMDGPVVTDAKAALENADATPVLKWVNPPQEVEVKQAFDQTLAVRKLGPQAQELADKYFFETLVRLHRASEGEPYNGLKPAGTPVELAVAEADQALRTGKVGSLSGTLAEEVTAGVQKRFQRVLEAKQHADESVAAGREYVKAYVEFVHYVERLHHDAASFNHQAAGEKAENDSHTH